MSARYHLGGQLPRHALRAAPALAGVLKCQPDADLPNMLFAGGAGVVPLGAPDGIGHV